MSDYNSSLPVRTEQNGDVAAKIVDGTITSQALSVDASGKIYAKLNDGAGNDISSQANGAQRALDVGINVAGVQIDPRQIRALTSADIVTVDQGTSPWIISGTVAATQSGTWTVGLSEDHNYGAVGASTLRTASQLGNATGAADFNYGAIGAQSLRVASQIGNATGAANFNNGATGAQTLRVAANLAVAGADVTSLNPIPVLISDSNPGSPVNNYNTAAAIASGATSDHDYTVTALKTFYLNQIEASGSSKMKIEVEVETAVASGVFNTRFVQFNSTSDTNMSIHLENPIIVAAGVRVRLHRTNKDNQAQDLYSTICGYELP